MVEKYYLTLQFKNIQNRLKLTILCTSIYLMILLFIFHDCSFMYDYNILHAVRFLFWSWPLIKDVASYFIVQNEIVLISKLFEKKTPIHAKKSLRQYGISYWLFDKLNVKSLTKQRKYFPNFCNLWAKYFLNSKKGQ